MMKLKILVHFDGQEFIATTNTFIEVAWERRYKKKMSSLASEGLGVEDLAFLAFEYCKQQGITVPIVFDDFLKSVEVDLADDQDTANPSPLAP